jgi:serine/threonine-protein kinase
MAGNPWVLGLLEEMLDAGKTPEEVCRDCPELLPEVRRRWQAFRLIDEQVEALLPGLRTTPAAGPIAPVQLTALPQVPGYEVESVLGYGGMGVVYRARQRALDRSVAVKMLLAGPFASSQELGRFRRETAALACLRHPNVVQVFDAGDVEGRPYFTMELVEGGSLARKLAGTPQSARQAAALVAALAGAVQAAHHGGIVHRDLKPSNVLLTADGTPKISDFGLARRLDGEAGLTRTGAALGTPSYMAPEQAEGRTHAVGPAADVYALGAILYELLTGRPPFRAETDLETVQQVISREPVPPSRLNATVPRDLETICLKCLHKLPSRRYATAAALAKDLGCFLRGDAIAARPEGPVARLARRVRRRLALSAAVAASAVLLLVLVGGGLWVISDRSAQRLAREAAEAATERAASDDIQEMVQCLSKSSWPEAHAALERATGRVGDRGSADLKQRMEQGRRDIELGLRLDAIVLSAYDMRGAVADTSQTDKFVAAFRDSGFAQVRDDPEVVAARIRESHIRDALVVALDQWISFTGDSSRVNWILEVLQRADPDSTDWRNRAGDPANWNDEESFARLIAAAPVASRAIPVLLANDTQLVAKGHDTTPCVKQMQAAYPGDLRVNLALGNRLAISGSHGEAIRYFQAVLAVRPSSASGYFALGQSLQALGRNKEAAEQLERALKLAPTSSSVRASLVVVLWQLGRDAEAEVHLRHLLALDAKSVGSRPRLRTALIQRGRVDEALFAWKAAIDAYPQHDMHYGYAEYCLFLGRGEEYRRERRDLLAGFGTLPNLNPFAKERIARACLLRPASGDELRQAAALAEQAVAVDRSKYAGAYPYFRFAQGLADYRQGCSLGEAGGVRLDLAISAMRGDASKVLGPAPGLVLAMALHQKGQVADARKTLAAAVASHDWRAGLVQTQDDWIYHVLRREAEGLILPVLPAFLAGTYEPKDNDERLALLGVCQFTDRTRALARLYADAFAADPRLADDPETGHRFRAARAAALVGCGRGADAAGVGEEEGRRWREQARRWLREDLVAWEKTLSGPAAGRLRAARALSGWRADPDLAGLRTPSELAKLPADEGKDCVALWAEVAQLLIRAAGPAPKL